MALHLLTSPLSPSLSPSSSFPSPLSLILSLSSPLSSSLPLSLPLSLSPSRSKRQCASSWSMVLQPKVNAINARAAIGKHCSRPPLPAHSAHSSSPPLTSATLVLLLLLVAAAKKALAMLSVPNGFSLAFARRCLWLQTEHEGRCSSLSECNRMRGVLEKFVVAIEWEVNVNYQYFFNFYT